jgi:hypothetical protein
VSGARGNAPLPRSTFRPASFYAVPEDSVLVPARCAWLLTTAFADVRNYHRANRGNDAEFDNVLVALKEAGARWSAGHAFRLESTTAVGSHVESRSPWLSTTEAGKLLGISRQAVSLAIRQGRLTGRLIGGRWALDPDDVASFAYLRGAA